MGNGRTGWSATDKGGERLIRQEVNSTSCGGDCWRSTRRRRSSASVCCHCRGCIVAAAVS